MHGYSRMYVRAWLSMHGCPHMDLGVAKRISFYPTLSYFIIHYLILSYLTLSYLILSDLILSYLILVEHDDTDGDIDDEAT